MANKKKKYNAKFPPARVKKIMQKDEEVGKVAAAVPVIIARALEFFVMDLMSKANERILSKNAKTLTPQHIKQTVHTVEEFSFLKELVAPISDVQTNTDGTQQSKQQSRQPSKPKYEARQESKQLKQEAASNEAADFKVPTRGRPKKVKAQTDEISPKSKKMKEHSYSSLKEEGDHLSKEDHSHKSFSLMLPTLPTQPPSMTLNPLFSPPISSFSLPSQPPSPAILFQPSIEPIFINNPSLTTSNKIADALQAINNNNASANNIQNDNNNENNIHISSILNINNTNILNYNNNLITDAFNNNITFNNTSSLINNNFTTTDNNNNNSNNVSADNIHKINNGITESSAHFPTDLSQSGSFSHVDEVLDLSKQASKQPIMQHVTFLGNQYSSHNFNNSNNISANTINNNNNNYFNKINNTDDIGDNDHLNNINENINRPNDSYKLNIPSLNSYHRSTSSS